MPALTEYRQPGDPIDERTPTLQLPLPHWRNDTHDDVLRLRTALGLIDTALQLMGLDMDSRDDALAAADQALAARAALLEYTAARPTAVLYGYDAQGRVATVTATVGGVARVTSYTYDAQGRVATVAYPVAGGLVRTETFNYDAQGRASGTTAVETNP